MTRATLLGSSEHNPACFLAAHGVHESGRMPACDGRLVRAHLLPRTLMRKKWGELHHGGHRADEERAVSPLAAYRSLDDLLWDRASWVMACGGPIGNSGHHGAFDVARSIRLPRAALPAALEAFAAKLELAWWLDREYGAAVDEVDEEHYPGERFGHGVCATGRCDEPCGPNGGCMRGATGRSRGR